MGVAWDCTHLKQYYQLRKAIQRAIVPALRALGEYADERDRGTPATDIKPLTRRIETALQGVSEEFPELMPLLGVHRSQGMGVPHGRSENTGNTKGNDDGDAEGAVAPTTTMRSPLKKRKQSAGKDGSVVRKKPGLALAIEDIADSPDLLGRMIDETVVINALHPAWRKALETKQEEYHIVIVVGLVLSDYLAPEKHPQEFLARLLSSWSRVEIGQRKLL